MRAFTVFIRHPILAVMVNLALVAAGMFSFTRLNVDALPNLDIAIITVTTTLEGASPTQVENQLTRPIEDALAVVGGLDELTSTSSANKSVVQARFNLGVDGNDALANCRDKVDAIANQFPASTQKPVFTKLSTSESSLLKVAVTSDVPLRTLTELVENELKPKLQTVSGVGDIDVLGGRKRVMQIELSLDKLRQFKLTSDQVQQAVIRRNNPVPGGIITSGTNQYVLQLDNNLLTARDFAAIPVVTRVDQVKSNQQGGPVNVTSYATRTITLADLGRVVDGEEDLTTLARLNGVPTLTMVIKKTPDANILNVVDALKDKIADLEANTLPKVKLDIVSDDSTFIKDSVDDLRQDLFLGAGLASLTVLVFLLNIRLTIVAALAIPVSLIGTLTVMDALGYSLNYMTLLALSLATGIVIDDAVVVLENIAKVLDEKGLPPHEAAEQGLMEISFAVLATTLSLVVLFLPLAFMPGIVGLYFRSWGITMAVAISLSLWVSFTLTPVLCAILLKKTAGPPRGPGLLTRVLQAVYIRMLGVSLRLRYLVLAGSALLVLWGAHLAGEVGSEFTAQEDQGNYTVKLTMPPGWAIERTAAQVEYVEAALKRLPYVKDVLMTAQNPTDVEIYVSLIEYDQRKPYTLWKATAAAREALKEYDSLQPAVLFAGQPKQFEFTVLGEKLSVLTELSDRLQAELRKVPGIVDLGSSLQPGAPEVQVTIDQEAASTLGVSTETAFQTIGTLMGGSKIASWQSGSHNYDVRMRLLQDQRNQPQDLNRLDLPSSSTQNPLVPFSMVGRVSMGVGPTSILHYQRQRKVAIQSNLDDGLSLGTAYTRTQKLFEGLNPPPGYGPVRTANSKQLEQTAVAALQSFVLSVVFMYMVMASQFESLLDPAVVLLTLPLAIPFALWSLVLAHMTLNLFSVLGLFLLFGVVKKNAILQIDETNRLLRSGQGVREAILNANRDRLRPILMTTLTLVLAMVPVAFAPPTAAMRAPMAMVVVGGQSMCLLLTLLVVPCATEVVEDFKALLSWRPWKRKETP